MNHRIRILLVDDNPYFVAAAGEFLHFQEALVVETATGADEALLKARQLEPDVILLDLNLGERWGLDLIPAFREHRPQVKIIILTTMDENAYRVASVQAGADAFVHKESMIHTLVPVILRQMDRVAGSEACGTADEAPAAVFPLDENENQPPTMKSEQPELGDDKESKP